MVELDTDYVKSRYGTEIGKKYSGHYEFNRWFINKRAWMDYCMTYRSILHHTQNVGFETCFELGPGPGTWTRLLYRSNPNAEFTLLDISSEMKKQFYLEMRSCENISYKIGNFMEYDYDRKYDLFFSSRAFEYLPDKEDAIRRIGGLLNTGGICIIATKNPELLALKSNRRDKLHSAQISASEFRALLGKFGFSSVRVFPVVARLPIMDRFVLRLSMRAFERSYKRESKKIPFYAESYVVVCRKK